jgi:hypothetical protein
VAKVEALQAAYREVPSPSRGRVQGVAMKRAMTEGGLDMGILGEVLDAFNNLPAASKTSRKSPSVDEPTSNCIRLAGLVVAFNKLQAELGQEAVDAANKWFADGTPEAHLNAVLKVAENAYKASARKGTNGGGSRNSLNEKVSDLIARGALTVGQVLKGAGDAEATVLEDGKIQTKGETFDNLSKAARAHRVKADGSQTSTNGWDFWTTDGKVTVGSLRTS